MVNKGQNQLELDRFRDLMFVHYILQLEETKKRNERLGARLVVEVHQDLNPIKGRDQGKDEEDVAADIYCIHQVLNVNKF